MRKTILSIVVTLFIVNTFYSQAKKPTIMVVPSDVWFSQNNYMKEFPDLGGTIVKVPDYKKAFQSDPDLIQVISQINGMMAEKGFPLKNMETVIKSIENDETERMLLLSKQGSGISESPLDQIKRVAKADIILQLTWSVNEMGPKKVVNYALQGLDSYTNKQIATATGITDPSISASVALMVSEAVVDNMDELADSLQDHFDNMFAQGREIVLRVMKWEDWPDDLETEYDYDGGTEELGYIIEYWLDENTVEGRYNTTDITESMALFEQVRIPLENDKGRAIDARRFIRDLSSYLKKPPYNITNKLVTRGLGEVVIILGGK